MENLCFPTGCSQTEAFSVPQQQFFGNKAIKLDAFQWYSVLFIMSFKVISTFDSVD